MAVAGSDRIMEQFGISPVKMGSVYSAFLLVYSLCMIPGGLFIDRFGPRIALMVVGFSSAIFGLATGATGWIFQNAATITLSMIVVRGTMGAFSAPLHPAAARAIGNWFPYPERSFANGIVTAAAILGVAISYPGFGRLIHWLDWPGAFCVSAAITFLLTLLWLNQSRDWPHQHPAVNQAEKNLIGETENASRAPRATPAEWFALLRNRNLILITLSYAAVGYFQYLFVYWMQYYFEKILHLPNDTSKYYAGSLQVALAIGMPLGGFLSGRLSHTLGVRKARALVSGGGMLLSAAFLGLGVISHAPTTIVALFAIAHALIGAAEGPFWATAVDIGGKNGGTAAAICNTGGNLGGLLAPMLTPLISSHFGWSSGIALGGLICFLGALCWSWIEPLETLKDA